MYSHIWNFFLLVTCHSPFRSFIYPSTLLRSYICFFLKQGTTFAAFVSTSLYMLLQWKDYLTFLKPNYCNRSFVLHSLNTMHNSLYFYKNRILTFLWKVNLDSCSLDYLHLKFSTAILKKKKTIIETTYLCFKTCIPWITVCTLVLLIDEPFSFDYSNWACPFPCHMISTNYSNRKLYFKICESCVKSWNLKDKKLWPFDLSNSF